MGRVPTKSDHFWKTNRKKEQLLQKLDKSITKKRRQNQCDCLHTSDHGYDVRVEKQSKEGVIFVCRNCKKRIYANRVPEKMAAESIKTIDMMCDTVKMNLNIRRKKDVEIANWIGILQYRILFSLFPLYAATQNKSNDRKTFDSSMYGHTVLRRN